MKNLFRSILSCSLVATSLPALSADYDGSKTPEWTA
jgi:hypothetical protein